MRFRLVTTILAALLGACALCLGGCGSRTPAGHVADNVEQKLDAKAKADQDAAVAHAHERIAKTEQERDAAQREAADADARAQAAAKTLDDEKKAEERAARIAEDAAARASLMRNVSWSILVAALAAAGAFYFPLVRPLLSALSAGMLGSILLSLTVRSLLDYMPWVDGAFGLVSLMTLLRHALGHQEVATQVAAVAPDVVAKLEGKAAAVVNKVRARIAA
jgi:hypothetical protein